MKTPTAADKPTRTRTKRDTGSAAPFGAKLESTLTARAEEAGVSRVYLAVGHVIQGAAETWLQRFGDTLSTEQRLAWIRAIEASDSSVLELSLGPAAAPPRLIAPDSPLEHVLFELSALAAARDAAAHGPPGAYDEALERERRDRAAEVAEVRRSPVSLPDRSGAAVTAATRRARGSRVGGA